MSRITGSRGAAVNTGYVDDIEKLEGHAKKGVVQK